MTADELRDLRQQLGLSQRDLAKAIGVSAGYIALLEAGSRTASADVVRRLLRVRESRLVAVGHGAPGPVPMTPRVDEPFHGPTDTTGFPFTVIFGPSAAARTAVITNYVRRLQDLTSATVVSVSAAAAGEDLQPLYRAVSEALHVSVTGPPSTGMLATSEITDAVTSLLDRVERPGAPAFVLRVDDWNPRGKGVHQFISEFGLLARRARLVVGAVEAPAPVPGVTLLPVPDMPVSETASSERASSPPTDLSELERTVAERRGRLLPEQLSTVRRLGRDALVEHPTLWLAFLRSILRWGRDDDLVRARSDVDSVLGGSVGEGLRSQWLTTGVELALRMHEYDRARRFLDELELLHRRSAGAFDIVPARIMAARIFWEESRFVEAREALITTRPESAEDVCRVANWAARTELALGDVGAALRYAESGRRVAEEQGILGGAAYSLALIGQAEILRGNLSRARRALLRALDLADMAAEMRVKPQVLTELSELCALESDLATADQYLRAAFMAIAGRPARIWDSAYVDLAQARIARQRLNADLLCSMAHTLTFEAGGVAALAPRHPVVAALHTEAAACWAAAGYAHQASLTARRVDVELTDWLTRFELRATLLGVEELNPSQYLQEARALLGAATDAGAPYLAVTTGYQLAARAKSLWSAAAEALALWVVEAADARGWSRLAHAARSLIARPAGQTEARGTLRINAHGTRTVVAPRRGQRPARSDSRAPLPDPFDDEDR